MKVALSKSTRLVDQMNDINNCRGAFIGLAVGDALGTTNEFKTQDEATILTTIVGGGPFDLVAGQWTDDTSMALCLAESIIEHGFDLKDQLDRYVMWLEDGYMSCTGTCFDIGSATYSALNNFKKTGDVFSGSTKHRSSGNGNIMRLAPVVIRYAHDLQKCVSAAEMQSVTTHGTLECKEAAALMAEIMFKCINSNINVLEDSVFGTFRSPRVQSINLGEYKHKTFDEVWTQGGYVVATLEFALWCFYNTTNFRDCVLLAANSGGDADTNAAVAGQIAGAYYGYEAIPTEFRNRIYWDQRILAYSDKLVGLAHD